MRPFTTLAIVIAASSVALAHAAWPRLPNQESKQVGMELAFAGTTVQAASGIGDPSALLAGDPMRAANLEAGRGETVLKLAKQSMVHSMSFVNDGTEGKVSLFVSADDKAWTPLASKVFAAADRQVSLDAGRAQGRYIKVRFELSKAGSVRAFQLLGGDSDADYFVTQQGADAGAPVNFASGIGGARLIYLSAGQPGAGSAAVKSNTLAFGPSTGQGHAAVYDLGEERTLTELGSVHSQGAVRLSVFAFDSLPEKENWRGRLSFDSSVFESAKPVATVEGAAASGHVSVKPAQAVKTRYIGLQWQTSAADFTVFSVALSGLGKIHYQHPEVIATTAADSDARVVTTIQPGSGRWSGEGYEAAVADAGPALPAAVAWRNSLPGSYSQGWLLQKGSGSALSSRGRVAGKTEGEGEDPEDPVAIQILWCPIASP